MAESPRVIAVLGFDGVQSLDLCGPLEAFAGANGIHRGAYETRILSLDGGPFTSEAGLRITPDRSLADPGSLDTLIVAGGAGVRRAETSAVMAPALQRLAPTLRRLVSVCTGAYGLAAAGLLDGRRATTHWRHAADFARRYPKVKVEANALFIKDGPVFTSAGVTAAIDLSLALIEEDLGPQAALAVARGLVVYLKRAGGQAQYSEPLKLQTRGADRLQDLAGWMLCNLDADLSVEALAERTGLSPRQFARRFKSAFDVSPAAQVERLRLSAACDLLTSTEAPLGAVAASVGFRSDDVFRRAFERRYGVAPRDYRLRFVSCTASV
jgi:transcriptional regulator GlxA family with amidase domain